MRSLRRKLLKMPLPPNILNEVPNLREKYVITLMKKRPVLILIYGTSGSGKSTMARRVASMYKIPNILSTDTVRNKMREEIDKEHNPIIHASTFETGDHLPKADYKRIRNCLKINQLSSVKAPSKDTHWQATSKLLREHLH